MSCTRPNRMFDTGYKTATGKRLMYFSNFHEHRTFIHKPKSADVAYSQAFNHVTDLLITDYIEVPCGECESCKADKAREWAFRCLAEARQWEHNCVINLTYNNENLPTTTMYELDKDNNVVTKEVPTLLYKDVQDFKKRLQRHWAYKYSEKGIRFVVAGEYGDQYDRPHYHIVAFNLNIRDKVDHGTTKRGSKEYLSAEVQKLWGKGYITIGDCTRESIQYVANYTLKKIKGGHSAEYYDGIGKCPEFIVTSRNPGIGAKYLIEHVEEYKKYGKLVLGTNAGLIELHSCQFLDRYIQNIDPDELLEIKEAKRKLNERRELVRAKVSGVSIEKLRETKAQEFHERIKHAKKNRRFA